MGLDLFYEEGQTPLDEDEKEGLLIPSVTTRRELNEVEQRNIEEAVFWTISRRSRKLTVANILTESFVRELHTRMLGNVWRWAGSFRNSNKNIGVGKYEIGIELKMLLDNCKYWIEHQVYPPDEIAIRFKHRIVCIHCFANGNGRHSRLMADVVVDKILGNHVFSWGGNGDLFQKGSARSTYLKALREADKGNFETLINFARS
jgi:Fic-DOC domain mobile mystery protein B